MAKSETPRLYLIDGTAQLFRAYFAIRGLSNAEGLPTNAVFGFTSMLRKLLKDEAPTHVAAAFDLPGEVFRHESYPDYKANRPPAPEDLNVQVPYAKQVCEALGVTVLEQERFEADDLIATFARRASEAGYDVVVVASDKDLLQLVGERVSVLNPSKELRLDTEGVASSFGVAPGLVRDVLGLMGDTVDNIPGVPGVGEKTAIAIVSTYGALDSVIARAGRFVTLFEARDALLEAIDGVQTAAPLASGTLDKLDRSLEAFDGALREFVDDESDPALAERYAAVGTAASSVDRSLLESKIGEPGKKGMVALRPLKKELKSMDRGSSRRVWTAIHEQADQARLSKQLATLHYEVPVPIELEELELRDPDRERARELFSSLGFRTLTEEFSRDPSETAPETEPAPGEQDGNSSRGSYEIVSDRARLEEVVEACRAAGTFAVDTETDGVDPLRARLVGISLAWEENHGVYLPVGHTAESAPRQLELDVARGLLGPLLADDGVAKIAQNLIYDDHVLRRHGLPVRGWSFDTMVAAFLLDPGRESFSMDPLAEEYLGYRPIPFEEVAGTGDERATLDRIPVDRVAEYAAEDADVTLRLARVLGPRLDEAGLRELYDRVDGPLLPLLARMEAAGIRVDTGLLERMSDEMRETLDGVRAEIHRLAGGEFNVDSPKQLREVLFERLRLKPRRKTAKSGVASTDARTLEELAAEHAIARQILEYRELAKLKGTYVDTLPKLVHPETGRVHTSYHPTGAATGRLSSSNPNLQNIPARTEAGRRIRAAFVPDEGYRFLSSDYSQVELRVLAHLCDDEELIAAFAAGEDIHRYTASRVSGVAPDLVTDDLRRRAKAVNFGVLYGMSETRLAREQRISRGEARKFIQGYFERFARVRDYIESVREEAREKAAVRTLFGRVRLFPQLHRRVNRGVQEQALRGAVNTTIQGTAADLMKLAMLRVDEELRDSGSGARILLQVHDELLLEVPTGEVGAIRNLVREAMEGVHPLKVPLVVDQKVGDSWLEVT